MRNLDLVILVDKGSRFPIMLIQGLLDFEGIEFTVSHTYNLLGNPLIKHSDFDVLKEKLIKCDYIFRADDYHLTNHKNLDEFMDKNNLWYKCIIIDFEDSYKIRNKELYKKCLLYFKRSWLVGRRKRKRRKRKKLYPLQYSILKEYDSIVRDYNPIRNIDVLYVGSQQMRKNVKEMINRSVIRRIIDKILDFFNINIFNFKPISRRLKVYYELLMAKISNSMIGANTGGKRQDIFLPPKDNNWINYMKLLKKAKIIFSVFPDYVDGDSRSWESMSSGALIFMDKTFIYPNPLEHGKHVFYFDATSIRSIKKAINTAKFYLKPENEVKRERIAKAGKNFALKHHMPKNRIEFIFKCLEKIQKE